jgi:hypothetical protein
MDGKKKAEDSLVSYVEKSNFVIVRHDITDIPHETNGSAPWKSKSR